MKNLRLCRRIFFFSALMQVRNKMVTNFNDIIKMSV
ncbi:flagellar hook-basal body complex protein FliE [Vibrio diazotrophicus]